MNDRENQLTEDMIVKKLKEMLPGIAKKEMIKLLEKRQDDNIIFKLFKELDGLKRKYIVNIIGITEDELWNIVLPKVLIDNNKIEILRKLNEKNNEILYNINFKMLDKKYMDIFGEDKINLISCYPEFQNQILSLDDKQYQIFTNCLSYYLVSNKTENWTEIATILLDNIKSKEYTEFILNISIENVDIGRLLRVLQNKNIYGLKNSLDLEKYEIIKEEKLNKIIQYSENTEELKDAVFQKLFGQSLEEAKEIVRLFGEDICNLHECDEKDFVICLKEIIKLNNNEILKEIYINCDDIGLIDKTFMIQSLKTEYFKEYKEKIFSIDENHIIKDNQIDDNNSLEKEFEGMEVFFASTDFSMIVSKIRSQESKENKIDNYEESWNRQNVISQHFCASYIRNDMLGIFSFGYGEQICYGFYNLNEDSLIKSGCEDICSERGFDNPNIKLTSINKEKYYTPNTQINETKNYNEMDFFRTQKGEKIQPDYIVAFRKNSKISNYKEIIKAYKDWNNKLPIVVIDIDKCLDKEKQKIDEMVNEYNQTLNEDIIESIHQRINNNMKTIEMYDLSDTLIAKYLDKIKTTLISDKLINDDFKIRRQEIEKLLKVKIDSSYYGCGNKDFQKYNLAKFIVIKAKEILTSKSEVNDKIYQLYQECLEYISNELSINFISSYKKNLNPQEYIDIDNWFESTEEQVQNIKNNYNNVVNKFTDFGISVNEMLQYLKVNSKEIDISNIKEYILDMNYIKYDISNYKNNSEKASENKCKVTIADIEKIYKQVISQEREEDISEIKKIRARLNTIISREDKEDEER